jgi:hypothetical protein
MGPKDIKVRRKLNIKSAPTSLSARERFLRDAEELRRKVADKMGPPPGSGPGFRPTRLEPTEEQLKAYERATAPQRRKIIIKQLKPDLD